MPGVRIRLAEPLTFSHGVQADTFTIVANPHRTRGIVARVEGQPDTLFRLRAAEVAKATVLSDGTPAQTITQSTLL